MLDTVVMSGDDVCCSVVFGTLVGVFVFSVMWSELLMTNTRGTSACTSEKKSVREADASAALPVKHVTAEARRVTLKRSSVALESTGSK